MMYSLGVDVGSVSTDFVLTDENRKIIESLYLRTHGDPAGTVARGMKELKEKYRGDEIFAVGTTGSGRMLAGSILGADVVKNEITAHGVAASVLDPEVKTVIEIGGQDSKIILLEKGVIRDFAMNTVCAAGTGAFLDRQAERMNMTIDEFSLQGLEAKRAERIAGRCAVFAESDIIHRQQQGAARADVIAGIAQAMVRNYLGNVARGKKIREKIFFQGGVSANETIRRAFENELGCPVIVPEYNKVMGAFGAAVLAAESVERKKEKARPALHSAGLTLLLRASAPARFSARTAPITVKLLKLCPTAAAWDASTIAAESIRTQYNRMPGFFRLYKRRISSSRFSEKCLSVPRAERNASSLHHVEIVRIL